MTKEMYDFLCKKAIATPYTINKYIEVYNRFQDIGYSDSKIKQYINDYPMNCLDALYEVVL